ncbi:MAG: hypothetical protein COA79_19670 [Planctomycetota bacterium]|nr:MAG: hypothetical protein COA79_19670 [Planctomycetota bacterium]
MLTFTDEEIFETLSELRGLSKIEIRREYTEKPEKLKKLRIAYSRLFNDLLSITVGVRGIRSSSSSSMDYS